MVTLITEQLRKQSLEEHSHKAFSFNVNVSLPAVGSSPTISWSAYGLTPESSLATYPSSRAHHLLDSSSSSFGPSPLDPLGLPNVPAGEGPYRRPQIPGTTSSATDLLAASSQSSPPPPPPPPKRHCRSLSVPEDLSRCRPSSSWRPCASKVWTPVKRRSQSGGGVGCLASSSYGPGSSSLASSSSAHSSSSPTFFSLALSSSCDSPPPWSFPWDPCDTLRGACSTFFPALPGGAPPPAPSSSSCSSSPAPMAPSSRPSSSSLLLLRRRRFSLSPVHIQETSLLSLPSQPSPLPAEPPSSPASPSPASACSTPSSSRRACSAPRPLLLPRCHSQPCDMRKPRLKRRHDPDVLPSSSSSTRPGLDFSKMTQIGSGEALGCCCGGGRAGGGCCMAPEHVLVAQGERRSAFSPAEFLLGRTSIIPLSESEEEEDEVNKRKGSCTTDGQKILFERDCTELDLNLIEEN